MSARTDRPNIDLYDERPGQGRKRLFLGLSAGTGAIVCVILVLLWVVPYIGLTNMAPWVPAVYGAVIGVLLLVVIWATLGLVLSVADGRTLPYFKRLRGLTVKLYLPLMTLLGRTLGFSKQRIRSSFVQVNNELVNAGVKTYAPSELLLLMPHCLQRSKCKLRLTYDIRNCKRCGRCPIDGLLGLSDKYGVDLAIATGGTIARRIVVQKRPRLILAVACERDLSAGIQDTYPLPVFGVLNERPHGPCLDTLVPLDRLEAALRRFIHTNLLAEIDAAARDKVAEKPSAETADTTN